MTTEQNMDWGLDKQQSKEQLDALRNLIDECWEESRKIKQEEELLDLRRKSVSMKESTIKEILESSGLSFFAGTECIYEVKEEENISGPQNDEDWEKFKGWVKEKYPKSYDAFFKMHMGSLNSFVKKELALVREKAVVAEEKGEPVVPFNIPGIPEPKPFTLLKSKARKK